VKTRPSSATLVAATETGATVELPDAASLSALRAWYEGVSSRDAAVRYLSDRLTPGQSSRGLIGQIRRQVAAVARALHREDLATLLERPERSRTRHARAVAKAIDELRAAPQPVPLIGDDVDLWLPPRAVSALRAHGIKTLAALTLRIPRRRRWWATIPGLGATGGRQIEAFFAAHPDLTERVRDLVVVSPPPGIVPWETLRLPHEIDGSRGTFRAPRASCALSARNDCEAVQYKPGCRCTRRQRRDGPTARKRSG